ncbi:metal-dependent hydrolase [Candidatus Micrarchaeota archaeon]|nr:metal-dependent hydrolase [Candidatus Micrarchaeota archaeon]
MNYRQHFLVGFLFGLALLFLLGLPIISVSSLLLLLICSIFALLPDVDHDLSKGRQLLDYSILVFSLFFGYVSNCSVSCSLSFSSASEILSAAFTLIGLYFVLMRFFKPKHRGITHSLVFTAGLGLILFVLFGFNLSLFATLGYFSHLLADRHIRLI